MLRTLQLFFVCCALLYASSCQLFRKYQHTNTVSNHTKIVQVARTYTGVPYRLGGNDYTGIDCSGLICQSYQTIGIKLPRISWQQAERGTPVAINELQTGDLVFFITQVGGTHINHSGIVTEVRHSGEILFIHAGSKGVREENLLLNYWRSAFAKAVRVL